MPFSGDAVRPDMIAHFAEVYASACGEFPLTIYIHGIGEHPPKEQWKREWDLALFGKPMGDQTTMAYWSDILHGPAPGGSLGARAIRMRAAAAESESGDLSVDSILSGLKVPAKERKAAEQTVEKLAAALAGGNAENAVAARGGTRANILPLPGFLRRPIARALLERFVKDVAAYFYQPGARKKIQDRLRAEIRKQTEPFVLVSHSLGTIVAFEVLSEPGARQDCDLLVTMGSPLGIQEVQDVLEDLGNTLKVPSRVRAWHNFADRIDPVAIDAGLSNDFTARPSGIRMIRVIDHRIVNERTTSLREFNPHSSLGYLSHPDVRSIVHHEVGFDSAGRFLVARDVAEEFVRPDRRIPVLIEVLEPGYWAVDENSDGLEARESLQDEFQQTLAGRISSLKHKVEQLVIERELEDDAKKSDVDKLRKEIEVLALRKYVSARLTPDEINAISKVNADLNIYAVWKNSTKKKLLQRSHGPLKVDAGRASFGAVGSGVTWAVLDTGVRWDHPHFQTHGNIVEVWDCTTGSDHPEQLCANGLGVGSHKAVDGDRDGHGTHVCGIIAGEYASGSNVIQGIAAQTKLIVYKVLDDDGFGSDAWIIKAIDHIFRQNQSVASGLRIHGVNLSLGGPFDATVYGCGFSPICKELRDLWQQGTLVCVAAGNEGQVQVKTMDGNFDLNTQLSIGDPANLQDCIAVGSVNRDKPHLYGVSWFSSRGPTADGRPKPDCVAPGERILSCNAGFPVAKAGRKQSLSFDQLYQASSGTSMACPHVAGLLAAFLSVRQEFKGRPDEVKQILVDNCNDLGRDRYHQGAGIPNLMKMLTNT